MYTNRCIQKYTKFKSMLTCWKINFCQISYRKKYNTFKVRENPIPVFCSLPHQYGQHLVSVFCTDDAVLMVNAEQHNLCLKLGIIQQVLKVLPVKKQYYKTAAYLKHFNPCYYCKYTFKQNFDFFNQEFFFWHKKNKK